MISKTKIILFFTLIFGSLLSQEPLYVSTNGKGSAFPKEQPGHIEELTSKLREVRGSRPGTIMVFFKGGNTF